MAILAFQKPDKVLMLEADSKTKTARIACKFGEVYLEQIKYCQRRTILPDSMVIQERENF